MIPAHGKSEMIEPLCVMKQLEIPVFVVFDADGAALEKHRPMHERDNRALLRLLGINEPVAFPEQPLWGTDFVQWPNCLSEVVRSEIGEALWQSCCDVASSECGDAGSLRKNPLYIGSVLRTSWEKGARSNAMIQLCDNILA